MFAGIDAGATHDRLCVAMPTERDEASREWFTAWPLGQLEGVLVRLEARSWKDRKQVLGALRPVFTAPTLRQPSQAVDRLR